MEQNKTKKELIGEVYTAEANLQEAISATLDACEEQVVKLLRMGAKVYILTEEPSVGRPNVSAKEYELLPCESRDNPNVVAEGMHLVTVPKGVRFISEYKGGPTFLVTYSKGISLTTSGLDQSLEILKGILKPGLNPSTTYELAD